MEQKSLEIFDDDLNSYYVHGTPRSDAIQSIFKNGLRYKNDIQDTTMPYWFMSEKANYNENIKNEFCNWGHKDSKYIVIVSVPAMLEIDDGSIIPGAQNWQHEAVSYYIHTIKEAEELGCPCPGNYIEPAFVKGCYDANNDIFIKNAGYYKNLPTEEREKVFDKIKEKYIELIHYGCPVEEYFKREILPKYKRLEEKVLKSGNKNKIKEVLELKKKLSEVTNEELKEADKDFVRPDLISKAPLFEKDNLVEELVTGTGFYEFTPPAERNALINNLIDKGEYHGICTPLSWNPKNKVENEYTDEDLNLDDF